MRSTRKTNFAGAVRAKNTGPTPSSRWACCSTAKGCLWPITCFRKRVGKIVIKPDYEPDKRGFGLGRLIVVADKGLNCGDNIAYQLAQGNGYIYSQSIRGADQEFKQYVLEKTAYNKNGENSSCKSRVYPRESPLLTPRVKRRRSGSTRSRSCFTVRNMPTKPDMSGTGPWPRQKVSAKPVRSQTSPGLQRRQLYQGVAV